MALKFLKKIFACPWRQSAKRSRNYFKNYSNLHQSEITLWVPKVLCQRPSQQNFRLAYQFTSYSYYITEYRVMYESVFWDTPNHKKKRRPVACQEVGRGAKIIAFFRCYTWRLRQNRVAATERDAKRGNNWATQRAVNCGVHSLGPAREHVETYSHAWKTLNIPNKDFNTRPNPVSFNSGPNAVTFCCKYDVSKTHTHIYLWKFAIIWFIVIPQSCCEKRLFATSCPPTCPSVRPSVNLHVTKRLLWEEFSWNIILGILTQFCRHIPNFAQNGYK